MEPKQLDLSPEELLKAYNDFYLYCLKQKQLSSVTVYKKEEYLKEITFGNKTI